MSSEIKEVIKKHFGFLSDEYGFVYEDNIFFSNKLEIQIIIDREPPKAYFPNLSFRLTNEANSPVLPFDWILYYFEGKLPDFDFHGKSLDMNMKYIASLLKQYGSKLLFDVDSWWIPALKFRLKVSEEKYHVSPVPTFKKIYEYIEKKEGH